MITVPSDLLSRTFAIFRTCGQAHRECVMYWLGPIDAPGVVDEAIHPPHTSVGGGYQIEDAWLTPFWFMLARRGKSVHVQIHTHPHTAFHSATDDAWALVHTAGFLSLVIPNYAMGPIGLDGAYLAERTANEGWLQASVATRLRIVP